MNITIRASALPRALKCPASALDPGDRVDPFNPAAALGTAVHEALVPLAESGAVRWDDIPALAARHGVAEDEVRALCGMASRLWEGVLAEGHPAAIAEMSMAAGLVRGGAVDLTGTADVLARRSGEGEEPAVGAVLDWKTGRLDADHGDQLAAYAYLAAMTCGFDEVRATVAWVRDGEVETRVWTREALLTWAADAEARLAGWDGRTYSPGSHCAFCPIAHRCDARAALARADVAALTDTGGIDVAALSPAQAVALHARARSVAALCEGAIDAIRARVAAEGDIEADGIRLTIQVSQARKADTLAAWPLIEGLGLTDEALCGTLDVSLPRLEKAVAAAAGRGSGKAAIEALGAALAAAGAITTTERRALVTRRT